MWKTTVLLDEVLQKSMLYAGFVEEIVLFFIYLFSSIVLSSGAQYLTKQLRNNFANNPDSGEFKAHNN